jgi:hypothetical protein
VGASLNAFQDLDPAVLQMLAVQSAEPRLMLSMAFKELAQNAAKIGNLNISPELLQALLQDDHSSGAGSKHAKGHES